MGLTSQIAALEYAQRRLFMVLAQQTAYSKIRVRAQVQKLYHQSTARVRPVCPVLQDCMEHLVDVEFARLGNFRIQAMPPLAQTVRLEHT
mgnify:CR=1 FL=1